MRVLILFFVFTLAKTEHRNKNCNGVQANFDLKEVLGQWYVVAIVPEKLFPERPIDCYRVEFSEIEEGGLRWLINKTKHNPTQKLNETSSPAPTPKRTTRDVKQSTIVRLRYHTEKAFDVWSKSVDGVNGCFMQVLALDTGLNDTKRPISHDGMMQLHVIHTEGGPFVLQLLWGRLISAVIYRQKSGISQSQLKPVFHLIEKLRGPQRLPRICDNSIQDLLFPNNNKTVPTS